MQNTEANKNRILSIDFLRGLVMIIMALDHVRDYFHITAMTDDPLNLSTTTTWLFFTRWITHYCAPVFVFLSGISAYLSGLKKTKSEQSIFLIKRGLWLILLEVTVITFGWTFNPFFNFLVFQVIWAIGASMIALGLLLHLKQRHVLFISIAILNLHNLLDNVQFGERNICWDLLHHGHFVGYPIFGNHVLLIVYPLIPWIGIIGLGYGLGFIFDKGFNQALRIKYLKLIGWSMVSMFVVLRFSHSYGDSHDWQIHANWIHSLFSFIDTTKYPPSLLFTCLTLGPAMLFLAYSESLQFNSKNFLVTFGKVPFFFYVLHIYAIHLLTVLIFYWSGYTSQDIIPTNGPFLFRPQTFGFSLPIVYLIWIFIVTILYVPCKWYNSYRNTKTYWWLKYL